MAAAATGADPRPIGVFDSGVGGLSVLKRIRDLLPHEDVRYLADQTHVPYGPRPLDEVRRFSLGAVGYLVAGGCKLVVVACNTASAAALREIRATFTSTPFVGMEPAVKPAAEHSRTRRVGVLATPATFQGALYASVVERFAQGVEVVERTLPGLVERIEAGDLDGPMARAIVGEGVSALLARGVDTIALACTHYPLVIPLIEEYAGPGVEVIDPSPAVARQVARLLEHGGLVGARRGAGRVTFLTTGDPAALTAMAQRLVGATGAVYRLRWDSAGNGLLGRR